ncbi:MAG: DUF2142 domain-containing protein [Thermodesulfobacteriota bacterium]
MERAAETGPGRVESFLLARERKFIAVVLVLAALKVWFFSAAFPFFNNVDEQAHFDLIWKYSQGKWPVKDRAAKDPEATRFIVLYGSPEYNHRPERYAGGKFPPPLFTQPRELRDSVLDRVKARGDNYEEYSPPLYYGVYGLWLALGRALGLTGAGLLYFVRFLNAPVLALTVWLAWLIGRTFFPGEALIRLGLPLAVAFLPQDVFYSLNSDVLSPLTAGLAFYFLGRIYLQPEEGPVVYVLAGLSLAAAVLVKLSNLPILAAPAGVLWLAFRRDGRAVSAAGSLERWGSLAAGLVLPLAAWMARNEMYVGGLTGADHKVAAWGWAYKPLSQILWHPIFTPSGLAYFLHNLLASFWRGEFVWHTQRLTLPAGDLFFTLSSLAFLALAGYFTIRKKEADGERAVSFLAGAVVLAAMLYLAMLSMAFDFGQCLYPSRTKPFFVSGRLILCGLIPFFILYLMGLKRLAGLVSARAGGLTIWLVLVWLIFLVELGLRLPVAGSAYNFFHAPLSGP